MTRQWIRCWGWGLGTALWAMTLVLWPAPRAWAEDPPDAKDAENGTAPADEKTTPKPIEYSVPTGSPEELMAFIQRLMIDDWPRRDEDVKAAKQAICTAAERILAGKPTDKQAAIAVKTKLFALETPEDFDKFAADLQKLGRTELAKSVTEQAAQVRRKLQRAIIEKALADGVKTPSKDAEQKLGELVKRAADLLAGGRPEAADVQIALQVARLAEEGQQIDLAVKAYRQFIGILAKSEQDKDVGELVKKMETSVRWLTLPGNEIKVEGTTLAGAPLDWSKYRGKVVLIDFWATWCGPCVAELPGLKENYDRYRDKGFEVVGISLDRSREALDKFVAEKGIPWPILFEGPEKPNAAVAYYGITSIPRMILVGRDGKVISTNARGERLTEELAKLLGPVEPPASKTDETPPAKEPEN